MKILFVTSLPLEINTSSSIRNRATLTGLIENGFDIDVITTEADYKHESFDKYLSISGIKIITVRLGGNRSIARIGRRIRLLRTIRVKIAGMLAQREIYDNLKNFSNHTDVLKGKLHKYNWIISSSDPKSSHLFVYNLLERYGNEFHGKWIQIWGDPFCGDITIKREKKKKLIAFEEKKLINRGDYIIYVSKLTLNEQKIRYSNEGYKMLFTPIPYMEKRIYDTGILREKIHIEMLYAGDYNSVTRDIKPLYEAVSMMSGVHLTICGRSDVCLKSNKCVSVLPRQQSEKIKQLEEDSDILIHLSNHSGGQIPGKIYQYSGTNKPIVFILDGDKKSMENIFGIYHRFYFTENKAVDIQKTIKSIISGKSDSIQNRPLEDFAPKNVVANVIREIRKLES